MIFYTHARKISALNTQPIKVWFLSVPDPRLIRNLGCLYSLLYDLDVKALVTLTSDLSTKNLEDDFQSIVTPQGTFYKVLFEIYLTLDGSVFKAEVVCQGDIMGRCVEKFE